MAVNWNQFGNGAFSLASGMMGKNSLSNSTNDMQNAMKKAFSLAGDIQSPWYQAGANAIPKYESAIDKYQDPVGYFNHIMSGYSASPYAQYQQDQAMRAGTNAASASGMSGSTPYANEMEQTAANISTADMDKYFQDIMGINHDYTSGLNTLMGYGQNSADSLTKFLGDLVNHGARMQGMKAMGNAKMGSQEAGGIMSMLGSLFGNSSNSSNDAAMAEMMMMMM